MREPYEYRTIRIERASWPKVSGALHGSVSDAVREAGGSVFGLWRGEIGWHTDEGAVMSAWPNGAESRHAFFDGMPCVVDSTIERLEATVRPTGAQPPTADGVYAHRWFEVPDGSVDEFIELSETAWPDFESVHDGTQVVGLWRSLDRPAHLLLITRYASLAMWEQSRPYNPDPTPGSEAARFLFMRRAELTTRTIVRTSRLVPPPR